MHSRARDKLELAVRALAIGQGDVRSRLKVAYKHLRRLSARNMPVQAHCELEGILNELTKHGPDVKFELTAIEHTMRRIRNKTGRALAIRIYELRTMLDNIS